MDAEELDDRAAAPRLGSPYFGGRIDSMMAAWAWHLDRPDPPGSLPPPAEQGLGRRMNLYGATPEYGELVVPQLDLPAALPLWCTELLAAFIDTVIQDRVVLIWDDGGSDAVTRHLAHHALPPGDLQAAIADDMVFLGMVCVEVTHDVMAAGDRIRGIAARYGG